MLLALTIGTSAGLARDSPHQMTMLPRPHWPALLPAAFDYSMLALAPLQILMPGAQHVLELSRMICSIFCHVRAYHFTESMYQQRVTPSFADIFAIYLDKALFK